MSGVQGAAARSQYEQSTHAEKERFQWLLREVLMRIPANQIKGLLGRQVEDCRNPSCRFCTDLRTRTTTRRHMTQKKKQERLRRWRGVAKAIGPIVALHRLAAEHAYAPGGAGYQEASRSFHTRRALCVPVTNKHIVT